IGQVQSQRLLIKQMLETEVLLKRKLMEAHEKRLAETQYNENKLKIAIKNLLESLDLNADINISFLNTRPSQSQSPENGRSSKSSGRLCSEFKRSSVLLERNMPISPSRSRRSTNTQIEAESPNVPIPVEVVKTKTPEPRRLAELQTNFSPSSPIDVQPEEEEEQTVLPSPIVEVGLISIIEESESEENTLSSCVEIDESEHIIVNDTREESSLPLRDVTNTAARPSPKNPKPWSSPSCSNNLEHSIELVRHAPYNKSPIQLTVAHTSVHVDNLTPRRSQLSFSTFNPNVCQNGGCSTPVLEQHTPSGRVGAIAKLKPKKTKSTTYFQDSGEPSNSEVTISGRPSRSCRPKSLKEPSIRVKIRNETSAK
ncbi:hypothetical protein KR093_000747, partial [Drosophila rubida]